MSWIENVKTDLVIQTGDGKEFRPVWKGANILIDYNTAEFNFAEVEGTLVDRREQKGRKISLEFYFQGENHLIESADFQLSAKDRRFWVLTHPYYGILTVQPLSLNVNNDTYNVSKITTTVIETITDVNPKTIIIVEDKIEEDAEIVDEQNAINFDNNVVPSSSDKKTMELSIETTYTNGVNSIVDEEDGQSFFNQLNDARSKIRNATSDAAAAMRASQTVIQAPALFKQDLESRLTMLKSNAESLKFNIIGSFESLAVIPNSLKNMYEGMAGTVLSSMSLAMSTPFDENDYKNKVQVVAAVDLLLLTYNNFVADLDQMKSGSGGDPDDYIPKSETITNMNDLVNFTMANLFDLALNARQERSFRLETDTDFINLAHRLYGLEADDSTIEELMRNNPLGLNGILNIEKDTLITYYI